MDPNAKVIIIFCDNVRRVLSRLGSTFPAQFDFSHLKTLNIGDKKLYVGDIP